MTKMFEGAYTFNQLLGNWKLNSNVALANIDENVGLFQGSGMNCDNYSATLIGWQQNNPNVKGRILLASGLKYGTNADAARILLINTQGWMISGDLPSGTICGSSSIVDKNEEIGINIFPNPSSGVITIEHNGKLPETLTVINSTGQEFIFPISDNKLDVSSLPSGIYVIKGIVENQIFSKKVVLIR